MKTLLFSVIVLTLAGCAAQDNLPSYVLPEENFAESDLSKLNAQLGMEYMRQGKDEVALNKFLKSLSINPNNAEAHGGIAILYERLNDTERAGQHYAASVRLAPEDSSMRTNYGSFLCRQDQPEEADRQFSIALQNPLYPTPQVAYTNAGICAMRNSQWDKASEYLRKALEKVPNFPVALYQMGELYYNRGRYQEARAYIKRYLDVAPHTPQTLWLGIRIERKLGNRDAETAYAGMLRSNFPDARETQLLYESDPGAAAYRAPSRR
jgi:type IV pilus assembly protein PilF